MILTCDGCEGSGYQLTPLISQFKATKGCNHVLIRCGKCRRFDSDDQARSVFVSGILMGTDRSQSVYQEILSLIEKANKDRNAPYRWCRDSIKNVTILEPLHEPEYEDNEEY